MSTLINTMRTTKQLWLAILTIGTLALTSCINIFEDVTFKDNGSGTYKMTIDMSGMKDMMEMVKGMNGEMGADSTGAEGAEAAPAPDASEGMSQMGEQLAGNIKKTIGEIPGISNVVELQDTATLQFGYTFDFANVEALNKAIKALTKEKYDSKAEETYKFSGKKFERLAAANIGELFKSAMGEASDEAEEGSMDMVKTFLADMKYTQTYRFPDRVVKSSSNGLSQIQDNGHTLVIELKPFDEEQAKQKASVITEVKLK